jgi:hypothetical protein
MPVHRVSIAEAVVGDTTSFLLPLHQGLLDASTISPEVIAERGYRSVTEKSALTHLGFREYQWVVPGLLVPLHGVDGQQWGFEYKADRARTSGDGKSVKYDKPRGQANRLGQDGGVGHGNDSAQ